MLSRMLQSTCNSLNFSQIVQEPTRFQFNRVTNSMEIPLIDHIYTNHKFRCSSVSNITFGGSDHNLIGYVRYSADTLGIKSNTIRKRSYKEFDQEKFLADLRIVDWSLVYQSLDVDLAAHNLANLIRTVLDKHAPWVLFQTRKKYVPWLSKETEDLMKTRDILKSTAVSLNKEGRDSKIVWSEYKKVRNKVNNRRKFEEINFKKEKMAASIGCLTSTWKTAKSFMDWDTNSGSPQQLVVNGTLISKSLDIANSLNTFFIEKVKDIRQGIPNVQNSFEKCREKMKMNDKNCRRSMSHVSVHTVRKMLKKLKSSKSTSIDGLDNFSIKISAEIIAEPLHHVICLSILQKKFPSEWKLSKVIPLHKKGSKDERNNYRPVAILSPLSKILERIIHEQIYKYFSQNKIFHQNLHGYRSNRSTLTALISMYDRWVRASSRGEISGAVLLDLSAAFDLVEPSILIKKLQIYGLEEDFVTWIDSYVEERYQGVWIRHVLSDLIRCDIGVPQGSILGPLLFLIYFNDLPDHLQCKTDSYADDTTLSTSNSKIAEIGQTLTEDCSNVSEWMKSNRLKLNATKTHVMVLGTQQRLARTQESLDVKMDGLELKEDQEKCELLLGCKIQSNIKWHMQVAKLSRRLTALMNLKFVLPFALLKQVTEGIFNSVLVYCLPLYGGCETRCLKELQVMQNRAAQIVCRAPPRANRATMFEKLDWLTVNQLVVYHSQILVYNVRKTKQPDYLADILNKDNRMGKIIVSNTDLSIVKKSFTFRAAEQWNSLPSDIRHALTTRNFKKQLKTWIFQNIPRFLD